MTLSDWLTVLSLGAVVYAVGRHGWDTWVAPRIASRAAQGAAQGGEGVKPKRRPRAFKARSQRSGVQNVVNAGSEQQDAAPTIVNVQNVQPAAAAPAPPAGDAGQGDDGFTLSARELVQLAEALHLRREGATVEAAVSTAFGVTKGGSEGWKRAKALFDAATVAPGAAPAGTYPAPAPPARRRTVRRA